MSKFKLIAFSKDLPTTFRIINWFLLLPILLWPMVFFMSIFFFDDPNSSLILVFLFFIGVNAYPVYLFILLELNARIYKKFKSVGYVIPLTIIGILSYGFLNNYISTKKHEKEHQLEIQARIDEGYIGNCDTYKIKNDSVFYNDTFLDADVKSFEYLSCHYGKDKNFAFVGNTPIASSDAESFEIISPQWQKDKNYFYYGGTAMKSIDYESFELLELNYSKDKNNVYFNAKIVDEANPNTFVVNRINGVCIDGKYSYKNGKRITKH